MMDKEVITKIDCNRNMQLFNKTKGELEGKMYLMQRRYKGYLERNRLAFPTVYTHPRYDGVFEVNKISADFSEEMRNDINNILVSVNDKVLKALNP